ncbi:MAG: hypothetical protein OXU71_07855 [Gammaproteobacteria bacterium]|nr:hypothetical protein [Gammaproteobacteria bacterium]
MNASKKCVTLTTVNPPTAAVHAFIASDFDVIIAGDRNTPDDYHALDCTFLDLRAQHAQFPTLAKQLPVDSYARKNLGYLYAIRNGYTLIAESDDDNLPGENWGELPRRFTRAVTAPAYPNMYALYTDARIWPRGFPLDKIAAAVDATDATDATETIRIEKQTGDAFIVQALVDGDPDVDAIHRLVFGAGDIAFNAGDYLLARNVLSPFNSQNTFWLNRAAFAFLYLPATVPFRCCDILRGYVAQYGIWARGGRLGFTGPSVRQARNPHDYLDDFASEMPLYLDFHKIMTALDAVDLNGDDNDLRALYRQLHRAGFVDAFELQLVDAWLEQLASSCAPA